MQPIRHSPVKPKPVRPWLFKVVVIAAVVCIALALTGCFSSKDKIVYERVNVFIPVVCPPPIKPLPVRTKPVNPNAVQDQAGIWWVGISPDEYGNLAINTEESIRYIKDQAGVVRYYRACIEDFNEIVEEKNAKAGNEAAPAEGEIQEEASEEVTNAD